MSDDPNDLDDVRDKVGGSSPDDVAEEPGEIDVGPPIRATFVIKSDKLPVAPWAQGWTVGAIGPTDDGHVTLVCEHDMDASPVAQLSAITGILGTLKQAQLEVVWWAMQTRGPLELNAVQDLDAEFGDLLGGDAGSSED
jgi:hypothetical protein